MATFKEIYDDLMAGKRVRRKEWDYRRYISSEGALICHEDITAIDWELFEPKVTITRKQFDEAVSEIMEYRPIIFSGTRPNYLEVRQTLKDLVDVLARKLGF